MPELPEVESYRVVAERALRRKIAEVVADDAWFLKRDTTSAMLHEALVGTELEATRRVGKLLLLDIAGGGVLGLHFGMSGTLLVDEEPNTQQLSYSGHRIAPEWDRFSLRFNDGGTLRLNDARRLGGVELDPNETRLGPDALSLTLGVLREQLSTSSAPLKARLMDQARVAGVGNLIADEALWRAGLDPARLANSLDETELKRLQRVLRKTINDLIFRGGSHTGDLMEVRHVGGRCPKDGAELIRRKVGGRTTYSCPEHQV